MFSYFIMRNKTKIDIIGLLQVVVMLECRVDAINCEQKLYSETIRLSLFYLLQNMVILMMSYIVDSSRIHFPALLVGRKE